MPPEQIERLCRWIDHGAPKDRPSAGATPAPAPVEPSPPPSPAPSPAPAPAPAPAGPAAGGDWKDDDVDFEGAQKIFVDFNRKTTGSPHGKFWTKSYDEFVAFEVDSTEGKIRLIEPGNGKNSNMIRGLEARPMLVQQPDGTVKEHDFGRMPGKGAGMPPEQIERLRRWIDHGAPRVRPGTGAPAGGVGTAAPTKIPPTTNPPTVAPSGGPRELTLVGSDTARLGTQGPADDGTAAPRAYVAKTPAEWAAIFDKALGAESPNGPRVATALSMLKGLAKGYEFASAPLLLLVGPVTDDYRVDGVPAFEVLADGTARVGVTHTHDARTFSKVTSYGVWWAVYQVAGGCPDRVTATTVAPTPR